MTGMIQTVLVYAILLVSGITGAAGDILIYRWAKTDRLSLLAPAAASWLVCLIMFGILMRVSGRSLSVAFALTAVVHIVVVIGWDAFATGVRLSRYEWLGVALALAGVLVIEISRQEEVAPS